MLLLPALGFSPHLPKMVCTGMYHTIAAFLTAGITHFATLVRCASRLRIARRICQPHFTSLAPAFPFPDVLSFCVPTVLMTWLQEFQPVVHRLRPQPRSRPELTQSRSALLWKPWIFGSEISPPSLLIPHSLFLKVHSSLSVLLHPFKNAPLPMYLHTFLSFGVVFQPRTFSAQDLSTSELLRTL